MANSNKLGAGLNKEPVKHLSEANALKERFREAFGIKTIGQFNDNDTFSLQNNKTLKINKLGFVISKEALVNILKDIGNYADAFKVSFVLTEGNHLELLGELIKFENDTPNDYKEKLIENKEYYFSRDTPSPQPLVLSIPPAEP